MNLRITQAALLLAAAGAVMVMLGLAGTAISLVALGAIFLGTLLAAPAGRGPGGGWWAVLAVGAALSGCGALLALASEGLGGLVGLLGGVAVLAGSAVGFPLE